MAKNDNPHAIMKHNLILHLTKVLDNIDEIRLFSACLVGNWKYDKERYDEKEYYPVDVGLYASKGGVGIARAFEEVKNIVDRFKNSNYIVDLGRGEKWVTSIIHDYKVNVDNYTLMVRWNKELIPYISGNQIPGTFYKSDDRLAITSSKKRYLLAELLHKNLWKLNSKDHNYRMTFLYSELRDGTNTMEEEYPEYKFFNLRVIKPTLEDMYSNVGVKLKAKGNKREVTFSRDLELIRG